MTTVNIPRREGTAATVGWAVRSDNRQSGVRVVMTDVFPRRCASIGGPAAMSMAFPFSCAARCYP